VTDLGHLDACRGAVCGATAFPKLAKPKIATNQIKYGKEAKNAPRSPRTNVGKDDIVLTGAALAIALASGQWWIFGVPVIKKLVEKGAGG